MKEPQSSLTHYRRKRFFCKLFWRKSPRCAALFGIGWNILLLSLVPFLILVTLLAGFPVLNIWTFAVGLPVVFLLWLYGAIVFGCALSGMIRICFPRWNSLRGAIAICGAVFFPLGMLIVLLALFQQKRRLLAALGFCGMIGAIALWAAWGTIAAEPQLPRWIGWGCVVMFLIAVAGFRDRKKLAPLCLWPLAVALLYTAGIHAYSFSLENDLRSERAGFSKQLGRSIEVKDFWLRQEEGIPIDAEPLASLIANAPKQDGIVSWNPLMSAAECRRDAEAFRQANPEFLRSVDAFLALPARGIGHRSPDGMLASILLPELGPLRNAAQYLAVELAASADDRAKVLECNDKLERLRDRLLADSFMISKLVAVAVEKIRLEVLAVPLAAGTLTESDWSRILAAKVDWEAQVVDSLGEEATGFLSLYEFLTRGHGLGEAVSMLAESPVPMSRGRMMLPIEATVYFQRDYRFALGRYRETLDVLLDRKLTPPERVHRLDRIESKPVGRRHLLSSMLIPAWKGFYTRLVSIQDYRRMVVVAVAVEAYRKAHGKLPDSLDFLPEIPLDGVNNQPFIYQHGVIEMENGKNAVVKRDGYRLYLRGSCGEDPGGLKARNAFVVLLPEAK